MILEQELECRTAVGPAVETDHRRNHLGSGEGSPEESGDAWHIGDRSAQEGVTWRIRAEPRSLSWP